MITLYFDYFLDVSTIPILEFRFGRRLKETTLTTTIFLNSKFLVGTISDTKIGGGLNFFGFAMSSSIELLSSFPEDILLQTRQDYVQNEI